MVLYVKGTPSVAVQEARKRGLEAFPCRYDVKTRTSAIHAHEDVMVLSSWLCEPGEVEAGVGYPDGTLLYWSREKGCE